VASGDNGDDGPGMMSIADWLRRINLEKCATPLFFARPLPATALHCTVRINTTDLGLWVGGS